MHLTMYFGLLKLHVVLNMGVSTRQGRVGRGGGRTYMSTFMVHSAFMAVRIAQLPASIVYAELQAWPD